MRKIFTLAIALSWASTAIADEASKTTAKQGEPTTEFRSPMILDTPFFIASETLTPKGTDWIDGKENTGIYSCDNVSVSKIQMKAKIIDAERISVSVKVTLHNRVGHDKAVNVDIKILNGKELAGWSRFGPLWLAETNSAFRVFEVTLPRAKLIKDPITMMRLTITAVDT